MLEEEHEKIPPGDNDDNFYTFGRVERHDVVIACLPAGRIGVASAATVAAKMISSFPSIRFGLLVGIGGGVPSGKADVRLGDVVISQPHNQFGGVVQYDLGKMGPGRESVRTGSLNAPPTFLLNALSSLQSNHHMEESKIHLHVPLQQQATL